MKNKQTSIAIFVNGLGDTLMAVWVAASLHKKNPEVRIQFLTKNNPRLTRDLLSPYADFISVVDYGLRAGNIGKLASFFFQLPFKKYLVVTPPSFGTRAFSVQALASLTARLSGGAYASFTDKSSIELGTLVYSFDPTAIYIDEFSKAFVTAGLEIDSNFTFDTSKAPTRDVLSKYALEGQSYFVFHPYAANDIRTYPDTLSASLLQKILSIYDGSVVITCTSATRERAEKIAATLNQSFPKERARVVSNASILEVATLIQSSKFFLGVDTGNIHLAGVLRHPTLMLGNNSNPLWLPRYNPNAIILTADEHCTCDGKKGGACLESFEGQNYYRCMLQIDHATVVEKVRSIIS